MTFHLPNSTKGRSLSNRALRIITRNLAAILLAFVVAGSVSGQAKKSTAAQSAREHIDLLVTAQYVVTMDATQRVIEDGAIAVRGDAIVAVGPRAELESKYISTRRISAEHGLVMPGLINGHTHAAMTLFRGIKDDVTLQDWLTNYIFPAEAKNVTEDFVMWGTRLGRLEMLRGGTTTYTDM